MERKETENPNFNIESKFSYMIETAVRVVKNYAETPSDCETPLEICLAYDVKNYMQKLIDDRDRIKRELLFALDKIKTERGYAEQAAIRFNVAVEEIENSITEGGLGNGVG